MRSFWQAKASRLATRINFGCWLAAFAPAAFVAASTSAVAILVLRRSGVDLLPLLALVSSSFLIAALVAFVLARGRFFRSSDAVLLLDRALGLESRLITAFELDESWPLSPAKGASVVELRPWRALAPPAVATVLLAVCLFVPLEPAKKMAGAAALPPSAWSKAKEALLALEDTNVFEQDAIEAWQKELEQLEKEPPERWFEHAKIEAGDHLYEQIESAATEAKPQLAALEQALAEPSAEDPGQRGDDRAKQLERALSQLEGKSLELSKAMRDQLKQLDPKELSEGGEGSARDKLREQIERGRRIAEALAKAQAEGKEGLAQGGAPTRGPGEAPLNLTGQTKALGGERTEKLTGDDLKNAALGDVVALDRTRPEVDTAVEEGQNGGAIQSAGQGGEDVHRLHLSPDEQAFLKRYFK